MEKPQEELVQNSVICEGNFLKFILCWREKDYQMYNLILPFPFLPELLGDLILLIVNVTSYEAQ